MADEGSYQLSESMQLVDLMLPTPSLDGQSFAFRVARADGATLDVWCRPEQLKDIIAIACGLFQAAAEQQGTKLRSGNPDNFYLVPVPVLGISFVASAIGKTALVLNLPGLHLGFEVENSGLLAIAEEFARAALTLAENAPQKQ